MWQNCISSAKRKIISIVLLTQTTPIQVVPGIPCVQRTRACVLKWDWSNGIKSCTRPQLTRYENLQKVNTRTDRGVMKTDHTIARGDQQRPRGCLGWGRRHVDSTNSRAISYKPWISHFPAHVQVQIGWLHLLKCDLIATLRACFGPSVSLFAVCFFWCIEWVFVCCRGRLCPTELHSSS